MAGKPKSMSQIKQLLLLHQQGKGLKTIARILGMSKNTVRSYVEKLQVLTNDPKTRVCVRQTPYLNFALVCVASLVV